MGVQKQEYNITSLQRGLRMLQLMGQAGRGLPASEIATLSALPVSTVHRFLVNLEAGGFLAKDNLNNYHLGVACVSLGQALASCQRRAGRAAVSPQDEELADAAQAVLAVDRQRSPLRC